MIGKQGEKTSIDKINLHKLQKKKKMAADTCDQ